MSSSKKFKNNGGFANGGFLMINLEELSLKAFKDGYSQDNADAKVCQDIVLKAIAKSTLSNNVTVKGGVVMAGISNNARRATQDLDLDFIHYSLSDESIISFVNSLNVIEGIKINIDGEIKLLSQQEYNGKRIFITISDNYKNIFKYKIDFGVHKQIDIIQEEYCFELISDKDGVVLLINSREQIFVEKIKSLLRFGPFTTRYKDIFDMYYLIDYLNKEKILNYLKIYVFDDSDIRENNIVDILKRIQSTLNNKQFKKNITKSSKSNWLNIDIEEAFNKIITYLKSL